MHRLDEVRRYRWTYSAAIPVDTLRVRKVPMAVAMMKVRHSLAALVRLAQAAAECKIEEVEGKNRVDIAVLGIRVVAARHM